jgi:hypothetical protein|uniref:Heat shock factor-binding protein 1 n=1 Tax=Castor canadensis TaxID=51338 RepID=A0A8C0XFP3_CASCN
MKQWLGAPARTNRSVGDVTTTLGTSEIAKIDPKTMQDLTSVTETFLQQMQDKFQTMYGQIIGRMDDRSSGINELENISDLKIQAGVEELEGENKIPPCKRVKVC